VTGRRLAVQHRAVAAYARSFRNEASGARSIASNGMLLARIRDFANRRERALVTNNIQAMDVSTTRLHLVQNDGGATTRGRGAEAVRV
jgi:hypothetical protein